MSAIITDSRRSAKISPRLTAILMPQPAVGAISEKLNLFSGLIESRKVRALVTLGSDSSITLSCHGLSVTLSFLNIDSGGGCGAVTYAKFPGRIAKRLRA